MKQIYTYFALILLVSCTSAGKKDQTTPWISTDSLESEYIKVRNAKVEQFKVFDWSKASDTINALERSSLLELENKMGNILKSSEFSGEGKINLITLFQGMEFGLLDGLTFSKDSTKIVYTTQKIFFDYFNNKNLTFNSFTPEELESFFQSAFIIDASLINFASMKLESANNIQAYGLVGLTYQMEGPWLPKDLYVFVSKGNFVYLFEKHLNKQIKEIPKCRSIWDSVYSNNSNNRELAWDKYCECYQSELKSDTQFKGIQKQLENILLFIDK